MLIYDSRSTIYAEWQLQLSFGGQLATEQNNQSWILLQIEGTVQNKGEQWDTWDFCQEYSCVSAFIAKSMQTPGD